MIHLWPLLAIILITSGTPAMIGTLAGLEQTTAREERIRDELCGILDRVLIEITEQGQDGADCRGDIEVIVQKNAEEEIEVSVRDLSSRINLNTLTAECAKRIRMEGDLRRGYGLDDFMRLRLESGPQSQITKGAGALIREEKRSLYTVYGYADPRTAANLSYDFPTRFSGTAEWNIHFLPDELVGRLFGSGSIIRRLELQRTTGEVLPSQLPYFVPGYSEDILLRRLIGTTTWFWEITVSRGGYRLEAVAARIPDTQIHQSEHIPEQIHSDRASQRNLRPQRNRIAESGRIVGNYLIIEMVFRKDVSAHDGWNISSEYTLRRHFGSAFRWHPIDVRME